MFRVGVLSDERHFLPVFRQFRRFNRFAVSCLRAANSTRCLSALASTKDRLNDEFFSLDLPGFALVDGTLVVRGQWLRVDERCLRKMDGRLEEGH